MSSSRPVSRGGARRRRPVVLTGLRGFESAARLLSFTQAADELALTQSSISRQVAALERQVGQPLFLRKTRALELTTAGARLLAAVGPALAGIDRTVDEIRGVDSAPRVSVTTYASFASLWLVPRLADFQQRHPGAEIRIDAADRFVELRKEGMDMAIRRALPDSPAASDATRLLCHEAVTPALAPRWLEAGALGAGAPADLLRLPLIDMDDHHPVARAGSWARWFEFAGVSAAPVAAAGRMTFSFVDQAAAAAIRGHGVVLGRTPMLDDLVAAGQLVTPFPDLVMPTGYAYYLVVNPDRSRVALVRAFADWVVEEFARGARRQT